MQAQILTILANQVSNPAKFESQNFNATMQILEKPIKIKNKLPSIRSYEAV
jgi:hypothetical protein